MTLAEAAESSHVDAVVHRVHDRAGREEQRRLEEAMAEQMDDADGVHALAQTHGEEHVADLADRRIGEHPFQVVLAEGADAPVKQGDRADDDHRRASGLRGSKIGLDRAMR